MKEKIKYTIIFIVTVAIFFIVPWEQDKELSWKKTFINTDTNPYGAYITYSFLDEIYDGKIKSVRETPTSSLKAINDDEVYSFLFINESFRFSETDISYLIDFLNEGNNVFISSEEFDEKFLKERFGISAYYNRGYKDSVFVLTDYPEKKYVYSSVLNFFNVDSCRLPYKVLAKSITGQAMFVRLELNHGYLYLHSNPLAFTNINLLDTVKYDFPFRCLSYLHRNNNIIWDEFQKQGLIEEKSTFRVILGNLPLRLALYLSFVTGLLYLLFASKRVQRIIPEITPPVNSTVEFLETIGNLYYRKRDYKILAGRRHVFFLDFVRKNYYLSTENIDSEFINKLYEKSGVDMDTINCLFNRYKELDEIEANADIFVRYNNALEDFYFKIKNR